METNTFAGMGIIALVVVGILYFIPAINAYSKKHRSRALILVINLFFGWTLFGWVICLAWSAGSAKDDPSQPSPDTHVKCPDCRELVLKDARICKHCGCKLVPQ